MEISKITDINLLIKCLFFFDSSFFPSLSKTVDSIEKYAYKLYKNAQSYYIMNQENEFIGFAIFYCNDKITKIGYLTLISVNDKYLHKGIGNDLLKLCIEKCKLCGMKQLKLEVYRNNKNAFKFYIKNGFEIIEENCFSYYMVKNI